MQWEQSVIKIRESKGGNLCALFRKVVPCSYRAHMYQNFWAICWSYYLIAIAGI